MKKNNDEDIVKNAKSKKPIKKNVPKKAVKPVQKISTDNIQDNTISKKDAAKQAQNQKKEINKQKIIDIRKQRQIDRKKAFEQKQRRKTKLSSLPKADKKAFLLKEKAEKQKKKQLAITQKAKSKKEYSNLTRWGKKVFRKEQFEQKQLQRKAKKGYLAIEIAKYTLLAALALGLAYAGNFAIALIDNSYAFQNTGQALATPSPARTQAIPNEDEPSPSLSEVAITPEPTKSPYDLLLSGADLDFMEDRVNILVLGIDESLERADWSSFRTDTMILLSIDFETNDVYMISLPRDSYVWLYNRDRRGKINSAFSSGGGKEKNGFEYSMNTVSMALGGIPVNHYICFDMNVVKEVVNALGGLYYDVDMDVKMNGRTIDKGYQYMDGQMVLDYSRQRKDSDIARADRQQRIIFAIFDEVKRTGQIADIPNIYSAITGNIYTDLDFTQIVALSAFGMNINMDNLKRYMLPGNFLNIDGTSYWGVDQSEKKEMVKEIFGVDIEISKDDDVALLRSLAAQKRQAVSAAMSSTQKAEEYVGKNKSILTLSEYTNFKAKTKGLRNLAAVKNTSNVYKTIGPLVSATAEYNSWFASFKSGIEARKAAPPPTA